MSEKYMMLKQDLTGTQGSWLATIYNEQGKQVHQTWCGNERDADEWFANRIHARDLRESVLRREEEKTPINPTRKVENPTVVERELSESEED